MIWLSQSPWRDRSDAGFLQHVGVVRWNDPPDHYRYVPEPGRSHTATTTLTSGTASGQNRKADDVHGLIARGFDNLRRGQANAS
jgi:hypothetical protein